MMKAHLLYRDRDFDPQQALPPNVAEIVQDLELDTLLSVMAAGDAFLLDVVRRTLLCGTGDLDTIAYRQAILRDCCKHPDVIRDLYRIAVESAENKKKQWLSIFTRHPSGILNSAVKMLQMFVILLEKLRRIADAHAGTFESDGLRTFLAMIRRELDDAYFSSIQAHLRELKFHDGVLLSAQLGKGNEGTNYALRKAPRRTWVNRFLGPIFGEGSPAYAFSINPRDIHGGRALSELTDRGINLIANAVAQSAAHIDRFLVMLRYELAFYVGCLNLNERLQQLDAPTSFPTPAASSERRHTFTGLYDVCLALTMKQKVIGNDVDATGKDLVIVTGANQGGKSTFLRSIGLAQLMMQCGLFVPAESAFQANLCSGVYTHYKREEDVTMTSGKLDEELARMSTIVDSLEPDALLLFNESFAATNEREGSEIARQIVSALLEKRIKVFFVTHLYELARGFHDAGADTTLFLRAERQSDGTRTFKLVEGGPLPTSYGHDLYRAIFGNGHTPDSGS